MHWSPDLGGPRRAHISLYPVDSIQPLPTSRQHLSSIRAASTSNKVLDIPNQRQNQSRFADDTLRCYPEESNKQRQVQQDYSKLYLAKMANAHAKGCSPTIHVPTTTTGKPIGLRSAWHR
ncbi:hypothetical protein KC19_VG098600 [Ceratodon purpureus]|uniref:Uncharacterized protein n=1 Tax=Ceratodon purpureus TaxID=3225 RepID=A0A8T0HNI7_CERPU|nr:hypothetical protein KC19_VG098600 [Ceratodon purpureus]